ncbi:MAG: hypothetical protein KatS3mg058_2706 [Roseiflexus sp.]|nr:MAG: hypothetical protein KatS3mg058_2706 [Roseiflexus sp.]
MARAPLPFPLAACAGCPRSARRRTKEQSHSSSPAPVVHEVDEDARRGASPFSPFTFQSSLFRYLRRLSTKWTKTHEGAIPLFVACAGCPRSGRRRAKGRVTLFSLHLSIFPLPSPAPVVHEVDEDARRGASPFSPFTFQSSLFRHLRRLSTKGREDARRSNPTLRRLRRLSTKWTKTREGARHPFLPSPFNLPSSVTCAGCPRSGRRRAKGQSHSSSPAPVVHEVDEDARRGASPFSPFTFQSSLFRHLRRLSTKGREDARRSNPTLRRLRRLSTKGREDARRSNPTLRRLRRLSTKRAKAHEGAIPLFVACAGCPRSGRRRTKGRVTLFSLHLSIFPLPSPAPVVHEVDEDARRGASPFSPFTFQSSLFRHLRRLSTKWTKTHEGARHPFLPSPFNLPSSVTCAGCPRSARRRTKGRVTLLPSPFTFQPSTVQPSTAPPPRCRRSGARRGRR